MTGPRQRTAALDHGARRGWLTGANGLAALVTVVVALVGCGQGKSRRVTRDGGGAVGGAPGIGQTCSQVTDSELVEAPQRTVALTADQIAKAVRSLFGPEVAELVLSSKKLQTIPVADRYFPPNLGGDAQINAMSFAIRDSVGQLIGEYVRDNFGAVTGCPSPTDACALAYLRALASKAYRRDPTADEQDALGELFAHLRSQEVEGYLVSATVEEATQHAVYALVISPQFLWRYEVGEAQNALAATATSPARARLTDDELASAVSFFLTDQPPDDELRAAARTRTLRDDLDRHVARILEGATARDWLRLAMEIRFFLSQLPHSPLDPTRWPIDDALIASLQTSSRMFLDEVLWQGQLGDLLTSRVAFLDPRLASDIYVVPNPSGAAPGVFAKTTLPADRRSGLLTDAGFLTGLSRSSGVGLFQRGRIAAEVFACALMPPRETTSNPDRLELEQARNLPLLTASEQVAGRRRPECAGCHETADAIGLVLDAYDALGRFRTVGDLGKPVETSVDLPASIGSGHVDNAIQMAAALAKSPAFVECMARVVLQLATSDASGDPWPRAGACGPARVAAKFKEGDAQTFGGLVRAVAASPAFALRVIAP